MATLGEVFIKIVVDGQAAAQQLKTFGNVAKNAFNSVAAAGEKIFFAVEGLQRVFGPLDELGKKADEFNNAIRKLEATSKLTGQSLDFLRSVADKAKNQFALNTVQANEFTIALSKLTGKAGDTSKTALAIERLLDLAAAQGLTAAEALTAIQQAILGIDEGTDKLFQKNPSAIYEEYAKSIGTSAGKLNDQQKAQALLNAIITDGLKVQGEYNRFLATDAGRKAQSATRTEELQAKLGDLYNKALIPILEVGNPLLEIFTGLDKGVQVAIVTFGGLGTVLLNLIPALAAVGAGFAPIGIAIGAVVAAATGLGVLFSDTKAEAESLNEIEFNALINELSRLNEAEKNTAEQTERRKIIIETLNKNYSAYLTNINLEKAGMLELRDLQREVNAEIQTRIAIRAAEKEVQEALSRATAAEGRLRELIREQIKAEEVALQAINKQIDTDSGVSVLIDSQKRAALQFLREIGRAGNLSEQTRAEQINRELQLTAEYYRVRKTNLEADVQRAKVVRDREVKEYQSFLRELTTLSAKVTKATSTNNKTTTNTTTTNTNLTENINEQIETTRLLQQLLIENTENVFERRRQQIALETELEVAKYQKFIDEARKYEKRAEELEKLKAVATTEVERLQVEQAIVANNEKLAQYQVYVDIVEELEKRKQTQIAQINREEVAEQQRITREINLLKAQAAGDEFEQRRQAVENWFAEEASKYEGQTEVLVALEQIRQNRLQEIQEDEQQQRLAAQQQLFDEFVRQNQLLFGSIETGFDSFIQSFNNTTLTGSERFKAVWSDMRSFALRSIADILKADIAASVKSLIVHESTEDAKTVASSKGVAARIAVSLAGVAKEIALAIKSIGAYLAQAAAKLFSWFASLGPLGIAAGIAAVPALIASVKSIVKSIGAFAQGGIATDPTLALFAEAGAPEAAIPLNARGAEFMAQLIPKITVAAPVQNAFNDQAILEKLDTLATAIQNQPVVFENLLDGQTFLKKQFPIFNRNEIRSRFK
jgi:hypothetical protein